MVLSFRQSIRPRKVVSGLSRRMLQSSSAYNPAIISGPSTLHNVLKSSVVPFSTPLLPKTNRPREPGGLKPSLNNGNWIVSIALSSRTSLSCHAPNSVFENIIGPIRPADNKQPVSDSSRLLRISVGFPAARNETARAGTYPYTPREKAA